jgi:hypothetical protein
MERLLSAGGCSIGVILCAGVIGAGECPRSAPNPAMERRLGFDGYSAGVIRYSGGTGTPASREPRRTPDLALAPPRPTGSPSLGAPHQRADWSRVRSDPGSSFA